jgi:hypothetical protein
MFTQQQEKTVHFIIRVGMGTTGTRLITEATCHLSYPSTHLNINCIPHIPNDNIPNVQQTVAKKYDSLVKIHPL